MPRGYKKKLSARLLAMAEFAREGKTVLDVGSDHAMLPLYLVENGMAESAILTDRMKGPLIKAYCHVTLELTRESVCESSVPAFPCSFGAYEFRLGDGLGVVSPGEAEVCVIAGMGGETIAGIMSRAPETAASFRRLILQPRTKGDVLRAYLAESGFELLEDVLAEEKGRMCEVLVAKAKGNTLYE